MNNVKRNYEESPAGKKKIKKKTSQEITKIDKKKQEIKKEHNNKKIEI